MSPYRVEAIAFGPGPNFNPNFNPPESHFQGPAQSAQSAIYRTYTVDARSTTASSGGTQQGTQFQGTQPGTPQVLSQPQDSSGTHHGSPDSSELTNVGHFDPSGAGRWHTIEDDASIVPDSTKLVAAVPTEQITPHFIAPAAAVVPTDQIIPTTRSMELIFPPSEDGSGESHVVKVWSQDKSLLDSYLLSPTGNSPTIVKSGSIDSSSQPTTASLTSSLIAENFLTPEIKNPGSLNAIPESQNSYIPLNDNDFHHNNIDMDQKDCPPAGITRSTKTRTGAVLNLKDDSKHCAPSNPDPPVTVVITKRDKDGDFEVTAHVNELPFAGRQLSSSKKSHHSLTTDPMVAEHKARIEKNKPIIAPGFATKNNGHMSNTPTATTDINNNNNNLNPTIPTITKNRPSSLQQMTRNVLSSHILTQVEASIFWFCAVCSAHEKRKRSEEERVNCILGETLETQDKILLLLSDIQMNQDSRLRLYVKPDLVKWLKENGWGLKLDSTYGDGTGSEKIDDKNLQNTDDALGKHVKTFFQNAPDHCECKNPPDHCECSKSSDNFNRHHPKPLFNHVCDNFNRHHAKLVDQHAKLVKYVAQKSSCGRSLAEALSSFLVGTQCSEEGRCSEDEECPQKEAGDFGDAQAGFVFENEITHSKGKNLPSTNKNENPQTKMEIFPMSQKDINNLASELSNDLSSGSLTNHEHAKNNQMKSFRLMALIMDNDEKNRKTPY